MVDMYDQLAEAIVLVNCTFTFQVSLHSEMSIIIQ